MLPMNQVARAYLGHMELPRAAFQMNHHVRFTLKRAAWTTNAVNLSNAYANSSMQSCSLNNRSHHTYITLKRAAWTTNAVNVNSCRQSCLSHNRKSRSCLSNASGKYLFTQDTAIQRQHTGVSQLHHYSHAVSTRNPTHASGKYSLMQDTAIQRQGDRLNQICQNSHAMSARNPTYASAKYLLMQDTTIQSQSEGGNQIRHYSQAMSARNPTYASGKNLLTHNSTIQKQSAGVNQIRHYSQAMNARNPIHEGRPTRSLLTPSKYQAPPHSLPHRHLSMAWLDSLAVTQAGWFRALGESQFVAGLMEGLQAIHEYSHLPWWGSIVLSTILMRATLTFPLAVYQKYILAKLENLKPEMDQLVKELKRETAYAIKKFGWDEAYARQMFNRSARKIWKELIIRDNCHPFKASALLWVQIPLWISMSVSLRNMASMMPLQDAAAQVLFLELSTGGVAWIPNLTDVDHSLILPVAMGLINLIITEVNVLSRHQETSSRIQKVATNVFRVISVAMIPIATMVPSCVVLYWVTSSAYGLAQNLFLMHPGVQRALRLPPVASQPQNPYQHMWSNLQNKLFKRKNAQD